jgi:hypothetical protein
MKTSTRKVMAVVMGIFLVSFVISCASTGSQSIKSSAAPQTTGFLGDYYKNLKPGGEGEAKLLWIKPGVDLTKYKKAMVDYVIFAFSEDSEYKGIDADEMKKIADEASLAFVNALEEEFPVVSKPGQGVLRVRAAIVDLKQSSPALSAVSTVVPVGLGISLIKKGATDSWTGSGATTAEIMVLDSMTNEVIACGKDQRAAGFEERFTKWGSTEEAFMFWGERFTKRLVNFTKKK